MPVVSTPHFEINVRPAADGVLLVCLAGDFDMSVGEALADALVGAAHSPGADQVLVDLRRTVFFDSHGIAGLIAGYEAARAAGRRFTVTHAQGMVKQVLDITGLTEVLGGEQESAETRGQ
jgi:anti-anti-sigma factor